MEEKNEALDAMMRLRRVCRRGQRPHPPFFGPGPVIPPNMEDGPEGNQWGEGMHPRPPRERWGHPKPEMEMSFSRRRMLKTISKLQPCSPSQISQELDLRPSSVTELLNKFEEKGWIVKEKDEQDSRSCKVRLSETAQKKMDDRSFHHDELEQTFAKNLTEEERKEFIRLCEKITEGMKPACPKEEE